MDLRVTPQVLIDRTLTSARRNYDRLAVLQEQAATGNRILLPSDDPLATVTVLANKTQDARLDSYLGNVQNARTTLNVSASALQETGNLLTDARRITIEGSSSANDATALHSLADEVDSLLSRLVDVANTENNGRYVFGGTASATPPFAVTARDSQGLPQAVTYQGGTNRAQVPVNAQRSVATYYPGNEVFQQRGRGATVYTGPTGAAPGTGTDSATGQGTLLVQHTSTTYAAGSGVQPGTGSAAGDTVLGPAGANSLTIIDTSGTGAAGTVSLNGGSAVAFTNTNTNLKVTGPNGEVVFVNTTAITPGFNGSAALTANGTLSTDGGASSVPLTFGANQVVTNSTTGAVTNINSTNVRQAGTESLDYTGSYDAFQVLMALRDDLRNTRGLSPTAQVQSIANRLGELDRVRDGVLQVLGEQSASLQNLDALENRMRDVQLETRKSTSELEGADLSAVVINLQSQTNLFQLTLQSSSRILDQSLLDFLK